jgi:hypothetical protein
MYINGKIVPVENIPGMAERGYIVRTFVNATTYLTQQ